MKLKVYVGCALTDTAPQLQAAVKALKDKLRALNFEVLEFLGPTAGTDKDVYRHDVLNCVAKCDIFVAVCDEASTGLGYEIGYALHKKDDTAVLGVAREGARISRLITGIPHANFLFYRYKDLARDVAGHIADAIELLLEIRHRSPRGVRRRVR